MISLLISRCALGCTLLLFALTAQAQGINDYRTTGDGNWTTVGIWQRFIGGTWTAATQYPGQGVANTVTLREGHDVVLNTSGSITVGRIVLEGNTDLNFDDTSLTTSGNPSLNVTNNMLLGPQSLASVNFSGTGNLTVGGNVDIGGSAILLGSDLVFNSTGNFTVGGSLTVGDAAGTFAQSAGNITVGGNLNIEGNSAATFSTPGNVTVTGTTNNAGALTDSNNAGVSTFGGLITNTGDWLSTNVTTASNMVFRGGLNNNSPANFNAGGATFNTNTQSLSGNRAVSFFNDVAINAPLTNSNTSALGIGGTTTINSGGSFIDSSNSGTNLFVGNVTVNTGGTFTSTAVTTPGNMGFNNGITNHGTFNAGGAIFTLNPQSLAGSSPITLNNNVTVTSVTVSNSNTSAVNINSTSLNALSGTGTWTQGVGSTLNYAGETLGILLMSSSAAGNTVNYNRGGDQTIFNLASGYNNLSVSGSGTKYVVLGQDIDGNVTVSGTAQLDVSTGAANLTVGGDWNITSTNPDPFVQGTRTVTFDGTVPQTISTALAAGETFYNLTIANTSGALPAIHFNNDVQVTNTLTMSSGVSDGGGNTITVGTSVASVGTLVHAGSAANGWIRNGTLMRYVPTGLINPLGIRGYFPVGGASDYRPFAFNGTVSTAGAVSVAHSDATTSPNVNFSDGAATVLKRSDAGWNVTSTVVPTTTFTIRASGTGFGVIGSINDVRLVHANNATGMGSAGSNTGTPANPTVLRTGLSGPQLAGSFFIGSTNPGNSPLPVELVFFAATLADDHVKISWQTASERNNDSFTLERAAENEEFKSILSVAGRGTTTEVTSYSVIDQAPASGNNYYRLLQTDFDGTSVYSNVVVVRYEKQSPVSFTVYPNPSKGMQVALRISGAKEAIAVPVSILNSSGQVVFADMLDITSNGTLEFEFIFKNELSPGLYIIQAGGSVSRSQRLLVH